MAVSNRNTLNLLSFEPDIFRFYNKFDGALAIVEKTINCRELSFKMVLCNIDQHVVGCQQCSFHWMMSTVVVIDSSNLHNNSQQ